MLRRNQLEAPGSGLPRLERWFLNRALRWKSAGMTSRHAWQAFELEADGIIQLIGDGPAQVMAQQKQIPRLFGIEDASRNWSVLMVVQHLIQLNHQVLQIVSKLLAEESGASTFSMEALQPDANVDPLVLENYRLKNQEIESLVDRYSNLRGEELAAHPWFGLLDAHQWLVFAVERQRVHRRQCRKILTTIGVI